MKHLRNPAFIAESRVRRGATVRPSAAPRRLRPPPAGSPSPSKGVPTCHPCHRIYGPPTRPALADAHPGHGNAPRSRSSPACSSPHPRTPAVAAATLLSQGQPATASSTENAGTPAADAVDGNTGTRWSSAFSDPQWIYVDLGASATHQPGRPATGRRRTRPRSRSRRRPTRTNWTTIYSTTTGTGGIQTLNVTGTGRYVRMYGTARATQYGYSLWEFQVYGTIGGGTRLQHRHERRAEQAGDRVVDRERGLRRRRPRSTATPAPAGPARSPTRSGSRSTSAARRRSAR